MQTDKRLNMTLINGWKTFWRWWSTWLVAIGSSIAAFAPEISEALLHAWSILPIDIRDSFPPEWVRYAGAAIAFLAIPAKLVRQSKVHADVLAGDDEAAKA